VKLGLAGNRPTSQVSKKINADDLKVLADLDVKARFNAFAFKSITWSPAEIAAMPMLRPGGTSS